MSVTGQLVNVRRAFENGIFGGSSCLNTLPKSLRNHNLAKKYFNMDLPSFNQGTREDEGRKIMFLIRYVRSCHQIGRQNCLFSSAVSMVSQGVRSPEFTTYTH
jgi:chemotaxis receptor (MCP) glutamine deamidase CheD